MSNRSARTLTIAAIGLVVALLLWTIGRDSPRAFEAPLPDGGVSEDDQPADLVAETVKPERSSSATAAEALREQSASGPSTGQILVTVESGGRPLEGIGLGVFTKRTVLTRRPAEMTTRTGSAGTATFKTVAPGEYYVRADGEDAETLYLPSWGPIIEGEREGYSTSAVTVVAGRTSTVALSLLHAAKLRGFVYGPHGSPLPGASIAAEIVSGAHVTQVTTDNSGTYEAVVYPGRYIVSAAADWILTGVPSPPPIAAQLTAGQETIVDFGISPGPCSVSGRVVDNDGQPFRGLAVRAYYTAAVTGRGLASIGDIALDTRTDQDGKFVLDGLYPLPISLQVGLGQKMLMRHLAPPPQFDLSVSTKTHHEIGELVIERQLVSWFEVVFEPDHQWAVAQTLTPRDLRITVRNLLTGEEYGRDRSFKAVGSCGRAWTTKEAGLEVEVTAYFRDEPVAVFELTTILGQSILKKVQLP
jgi:hypothetical protein